MQDPNAPPQTDSLGPADVRWLQSEFRATRELQVALNGATNTRLTEHHDRITALEVARANGKTRRKRWTVTGLVVGLITVGSALANMLSGLPRIGPVP